MDKKESSNEEKLCPSNENNGSIEVTEVLALSFKLVIHDHPTIQHYIIFSADKELLRKQRNGQV
jgi:hypothetical protein